MDLERDGRLKELDVELVSIMVDPLPDLAGEVKKYGITGPVLSDGDRKVCASYKVNCQSMGGKPGHTFLLVGKDGVSKWFRDYGALMYVQVDALYDEFAKRY